MNKCDKETETLYYYQPHNVDLSHILSLSLTCLVLTVWESLQPDTPCQIRRLAVKLDTHTSWPFQLIADLVISSKSLISNIKKLNKAQRG